MKKLLASLLLIGSISPVFASGNGPAIIISDGRIQFSVQGSGGWVCSAYDSFKEIPVLGRGETRMEAEANAKYAASIRAGRDGNDFFSKISSCETSESGRGSIVMTSDNSGTRIVVTGPSAYQCLSKGTFRAVPFIAKAATKTEASALAGSGCAADAGDDGFFCKTTCEKLATAVTAGPGSVEVGGVSIELPKIRIPGRRR